MTTYHGSEAKVAVDIDNGVAYTDADQVQSVSFEFDGGILTLHELGSRDPSEIKQGHITITGTIERYFETGNFSSAGTTFLGMATGTTEFWVALFPEGDASPKILVNNCKFGGYTISQDLDGVTRETASFAGKTVAVS